MCAQCSEKDGRVGDTTPYIITVEGMQLMSYLSAWTIWMVGMYEAEPFSPLDIIEYCLSAETIVVIG